MRVMFFLECLLWIMLDEVTGMLDRAKERILEHVKGAA